MDSDWESTKPGHRVGMLVGISRLLLEDIRLRQYIKENFIACGYFEGRGGEKRQSGQGQYPYGSTGNHYWEKGARGRQAQRRIAKDDQRQAGELEYQGSASGGIGRQSCCSKRSIATPETNFFPPGHEEECVVFASIRGAGN